jgi:chorismate synthase
MSANIFGERFKILSFGESHGVALGVVIDGCPAGIHFDLSKVQEDLDRRKPGILPGTSQRREKDECELLSGVFEGKTLGTPICMIVRNMDSRSQDYNEIKNNPRHGHADDMWKSKFHHSDYRGGGRSSGRETLARVMAGSVAKFVLNTVSNSTKVNAIAVELGPHKIENGTLDDRIKEELIKAQQNGESWGGLAEVIIENPPKNLGQPVFHKLKADLAYALMSIGATTAFELGEGLSAKNSLGSEFHKQNQSHQYGGIRGGISTGESIHLRVAFKPTSTILDLAKKGRHDPCIVLRALPVLEAMTNLVLVDHLLWMRTDRVS